jgi:hypothetical protein
MTLVVTRERIIAITLPLAGITAGSYEAARSRFMATVHSEFGPFQRAVLSGYKQKIWRACKCSNWKGSYEGTDIPSCERVEEMGSGSRTGYMLFIGSCRGLDSGPLHIWQL